MLDFGIGILGGWATRRLTGSLILGLIGGYCLYKVAGTALVVSTATTSTTTPVVLPPAPVVEAINTGSGTLIR